MSRHRFFEAFAGGAALTWALSGHACAASLKASGRKRGRPVVINDVNPELVVTYRTVQSDVEALIVELTALTGDTSGDRYYEVRGSDPSSDVERAARMIFVNRLSFNGLYRVNGSGKSTVPYGKVAKPVICDPELLRRCSRWLAHIEIREGSVVAAVADATVGDVVYLDPPYIPLTPTASFSKYAADDFREMDQWSLAGLIRGLTSRGVRVLFSNSNTALTRAIYGEELNLFAISASRSISASAASRKSVEEVLGVNYSIDLAADPKTFSGLRLLTTGKVAAPAPFNKTDPVVAAPVTAETTPLQGVEDEGSVDGAVTSSAAPDDAGDMSLGCQVV